LLPFPSIDASINAKEALDGWEIIYLRDVITLSVHPSMYQYFMPVNWNYRIKKNIEERQTN
jgi:hypothetical protein